MGILDIVKEVKKDYSKKARKEWVKGTLGDRYTYREGGPVRKGRRGKKKVEEGVSEETE